MHKSGQEKQEGIGFDAELDAATLLHCPICKIKLSFHLFIIQLFICFCKCVKYVILDYI